MPVYSKMQNQNMNILMISMDYPPTPGGISAHVQELSRALALQGNRVSVITRKRKNDQEYSKEGDIDIFRVPLSFAAIIYGLQIRKFTRKLLARVQPDIIHIHGMLPLEWYNINHIPLVYTNHTSGYLKRIQKGGFRRMAMLKRHFNKVDLFLAPSRELLEIPFPVRAEKIFIPNGVDGKKFLFDSEKRKRIRRKLGIDEKETVAIVTRRLVKKNGVIHLARATAYLDNTVRFLVIGAGPEQEAVKKEFKQHCGDRTIFTGNKKHAEIIDFYSAADFSILPSLMEATSISGLEAMAAGLPLIGTDVGGIPELIEDGKNGFLCKPADPGDLAKKIQQLLREDLKQFGNNSRKRVETSFDWSEIARKTRKAYSTLSI